MGLMANNQGLLAGMKKLSPGTAIFQQDITQMFKHTHKLAPFDICRRRDCA
jgi:hypothetical protein